MRRIAILWILISAPAGYAQEAKNQPVVVKRTPAKPSPDDAALQKAIQANLSGLGEVPRIEPGAGAAGGKGAEVSLDEVPSDFHPPDDVPLSPTAEAAVRVSEKWLTDTVTPAPGPDGRVLYTYGAGLATVVCAPLRVCTIELQTGERLVDQPHVGDSLRWHISPAVYGRDNASTTVLIIKPQEPALDTTLLIPTDRRIYYVRLLSKPEDYTARVAFAYPNEDMADQRWQEHILKQEEERLAASRISELAPAAVEAMNFNYEIKGSKEIRPVMVFDDGAKTFIRMNPEMKHRELPVLVVVGSDGKAEMVNYRVKDDLYIADRLFDRAQLVQGAGKKALKVEIRRGKSNQ